MSDSQSINETDIGAISYPSMGGFVFDVPEPGDFSAQFIYKRYVVNERSSTNSAVYEMVDGVQTFIEDARYINLIINPPSSTNLLDNEETIVLTASQKASLVEAYISTVNSEEDIQGSKFSTLTIEDSVTSADITNSIIEAAATQAGLTTLSISDALSLMSTNKETLDVDALLNAAEIGSSDPYKFYDPSEGTHVSYSQVENPSSFSINFAINNKFLADILKTSESASLSPLFGKINGDISTAESLQITARSSQNSSILSMEDYMPTMQTISESTTSDSSSGFLPGVAFLGYMIQKNEIINGEEVLVTNAYLDGAFEASAEDTTTELNDFLVKYGSTYTYKIKTLYLLRWNEYASTGETTQKYSMVSSRSAPFVKVECVEKIPPTPPNGIEFVRQQNGSIQLFWTPGSNPTGDVVKYQVFRRKTIDEPFTLIRQIDFDYTEEQVESPETVPSQSIIKQPYAWCNFFDYEFDNFSEYIYAVCAVDAHHLSSNYSPQFKVKYDQTVGRLKVDMISPEGAPKPYPNFLLPEILFEDSVKDSLHKYLDIYFTPNYYKINDGDGATASDPIGDYSFIPFVNDSDVGGIRMQIINLDRQNSKNVHIILNNELETDPDDGSYVT